MSVYSVLSEDYKRPCKTRKDVESRRPRCFSITFSLDSNKGGKILDQIKKKATQTMMF